MAEKLSETLKSKRKSSNTNAKQLAQQFDLGKLPPQAIDLEEAVLGALMLEKEAVNEVIDILSKDSFYKDAHQKIYNAVLTLFAESKPIDILTVTEQLKKEGELEAVGGPFFISQLTNRVASAANIEFHARIIAQKYIQRELIRISSETIKAAYDESTDVFDLLDSAESNLFKVAEGNIRKSTDTMTDLISQAIKHVEEMGKKDGGVSGVPTGFGDLDTLTGGFQPSDMVVLAARPGMGKTAFVLSMARNTAVEFKKPIAVFSLEMSSLQLVNRLIASETELSAEKLKKGNLESYEWEQLHAKIGRLAEAPIFIDDTPALSVFELRAKCRRLKAQHDIQMVVIDYLQLMTASSEKGNREQEISTISRSIKTIAKELSIPIIALSQLSRAVETRGGSKRPMLSDLRESGAIEQDADMVMFIYRPEYYGITEDEDGESVEGIGDIIVAKHRNGALDDIRLKFIPHLAKFDNLNSGGGFDVPSNGGLPQSQEFGQVNTQTRKSKMNDETDDFTQESDSPF